MSKVLYDNLLRNKKPVATHHDMVRTYYSLEHLPCSTQARRRELSGGRETTLCHRHPASQRSWFLLRPISIMVITMHVYPDIENKAKYLGAMIDNHMGFGDRICHNPHKHNSSGNSPVRTMVSCCTLLRYNYHILNKSCYRVSFCELPPHTCTTNCTAIVVVIISIFGK